MSSHELISASSLLLRVAVAPIDAYPCEPKMMTIDPEVMLGYGYRLFVF